MYTIKKEILWDLFDMNRTAFVVNDESYLCHMGRNNGMQRNFM